MPTRYLAAAGYGYNGVTIYDVTDPGSPSELGTVVNSAGELNSPWGLAKYVDQPYLLAAQAPAVGGVSLIDVSDVENPAVVDDLNSSNYNDGRYAYGHPDGDHAIATFRADSYLGIFLRGETVTEAGAYDDAIGGSMASPQGMIINAAGTIVYVAAGFDDGITVIDISTIASPSLAQLCAFTGGNNPVGVCLNGDEDVVFVSQPSTIFALDAGYSTGSPTALVTTPLDSLATTGTGPRCIRVYGNYLFAFASDPLIESINVADPEAMALADTLAVGGIPAGAGQFDISADGQYLYVPTGTDDSVDIIDISDPTNMSLAGTINDVTKLDNCRAVAYWGPSASGNLVVPSGLNSGLRLSL